MNATWEIILANGVVLVVEDIYVHDGCLSVWIDRPRLGDRARELPAKQPDAVLSPGAWTAYRSIRP